MRWYRIKRDKIPVNTKESVTVVWQTSGKNISDSYKGYSIRHRLASEEPSTGDPKTARYRLFFPDVVSSFASISFRGAGFAMALPRDFKTLKEAKSYAERLHETPLQTLIREVTDTKE